MPAIRSKKSVPPANAPPAPPPPVEKPPIKTKFIDTIDPDDEGYRRALIRPATIKEDVEQMVHRQRVSNVLKTPDFRPSLEEIVGFKYSKGVSDDESLTNKLSDLFIPRSRVGNLATSAPVMPVNDVRSFDNAQVGKLEKIMRCKVATLYRVIDLRGWSNGFRGSITYRISADKDHFFVNPHGLMYHEITASNLLKVDSNADLLDNISSGLSPNKSVFDYHMAVHMARPDLRCIIHLSTTAISAVSSMRTKFLPISQEALIVGEVAYHDPQSVVKSQEETNGDGGAGDQMDFLKRQRETIAKDLGATAKVLFLQNEGALACGQTIEEAYHVAFNLMAAAETQISISQLGLDNIILPPDSAIKRAYEFGNKGGGGVNVGQSIPKGNRELRVGELEYAALMRFMDNAGFRTGYLYLHPYTRHAVNVSHKLKERSDRMDIEIPPTTIGGKEVREIAPEVDGKTWDESEYESKFGLVSTGRPKWTFSAPNVYQKRVETTPQGGYVTKSMTRWEVEQENAKHAASSEPLFTGNPNQFAPQGTNPREFKEVQKKVRREYLTDHIHAGPKSKILADPGWADTIDEALAGTGARARAAGASREGERVVFMGASSQGIIARNQQLNPTVYKMEYAANPFANIDEEDLERYQRQIMSQTPGETLPSEDRDATPTPGTPTQVTPTPGRRPMTAKVTAEKDKTGPSDEGVMSASSSAQQGFRSPTSEDEDLTTATETDTGAFTSPTSGDEAPGHKKKKKKKKFRIPSFARRKKHKETNV